MQMSEDVCVKILCGNISEFIELFTRFLVYYSGDLFFDVQILKYFIFGMKSRRLISSQIMNLGEKQ